jgi:hypothetical protein
MESVAKGLVLRALLRPTNRTTSCVKAMHATVAAAMDDPKRPEKTRATAMIDPPFLCPFQLRFQRWPLGETASRIHAVPVV